jgi:AraC family transcriptional regulator
MGDLMVSQAEMVMNSKHLGWSHLDFSVYNGVPPQKLCCPAAGKHRILIHKSPAPVRVTEQDGSQRCTGWVKSGDTYLLPAGTAFTFCPEDTFSFMWLELTPDFLRQTAAQSRSFPAGSEKLSQEIRFPDPKLLQIGSWLAEELHGNPGGAQFADSLANILAIHLLRHYAENSPKQVLAPEHLTHFQFADVFDYMNAHLDRDISLSELAQAANVSPPHLVRLFKRSTGFSPHQYLIHLRIQRAKDYLIRGKHSLSEIAALTGFADQSHFSRHFKRIVGCTPKAFLNQLTF